MNKLKSAIADKVLEISSSNSNDENIRTKLENINRFRDFAYACQTLILKYPAIESELLRMIDKNDFDTKIASSRVDTIIRLSENEANNNQSHQNIEKDISKLEEITEQLPVYDDASNTLVDNTPEYKSISDQPIRYLPEDIEYENVPSNLNDSSNDDKKGQYIDFEEVDSDQKNLTEKSHINDDLKSTRSTNVKKGLKIALIIGVIVVLVFAIIYIIRNIGTVLRVLGVCAIIAGVVWFLFKKFKKR